MSYVIKSLRVRNFKCFDNKKFYPFHFDISKKPSILSGPNGFGKTTFFDAVELIFTKNITRLQTTIEHGSANLKKNILINEADKDGYIILELINENNEVITIIANIDHSIKRLNFKESIKYCMYEKAIDSKSIEEVLMEPLEWKSSIRDFEKLSYSLEHYNVFYYVSQAESVHFLKNSITERKDSMNVLLNTKNIDRNIDYLENELIGRSQKKKGVLINEAINALSTRIQAKIKELKLKIDEYDSKIENAEYQKLLSYPETLEVFKWDEENCCNDDKKPLNIEAAIETIKGLHRFVVNQSDYQSYLFNQKLEGYLANSTIIDDTEEFIKYFEHNKLDTLKINTLISNWKRTSSIYKYTAFFRNNYDVVSFKREDLVKLKEVDNDLISVDIETVATIITSIRSIQSELSSKEKILNNLVNSRSALDKIRMEYDEGSTNCPYCNYPYDSVEELETAYRDLSEILNNEKSRGTKELHNLVLQLKTLLDKDNQKIMGLLEGIDDDKIQEINTRTTKYQNFIESSSRVEAVKNVFAILSKSNDWNPQELNSQKVEIIRILNESIIPYKNIEFTNELEKYNFNSIYKKFSSILEIDQPNLQDSEKVQQKIDYLKYQSSLANNKIISSLRKELKDEIIKLKKLESAREKMDQLRKIYQTSIDNYKNQILKKLRVPLLIYTGKILQDYQNGLGVFVSKDEMRFVSSGDAKHDILNTFSSGQLSGFVLAFLFSMNKQYITNSDDIGFILIDDPVQTMDDINIASLIEVLRNDFANKQIILSTHESDKENYILYKFLKYNLRGQSFNVKEKLYV